MNTIYNNKFIQLLQRNITMLQFQSPKIYLKDALFYNKTGRPVRFVFESARAPRHFLIGKGHEETVHFYWQHFKGTKARGHGGKRLHEVSGLSCASQSPKICLKAELIILPNWVGSWHHTFLWNKDWLQKIRL